MVGRNTVTPAWLTSLPIAHRGLHEAGVPENSLPAFEAAMAAGYGIELDLRLSADGVAMVFHDECLDRLTDRSGPIEALSANELRRLRLLGTEAHIPSFAEVLDRVDRRVPLLVEVKGWREPAGGLESAAWAELKNYRGDYAVQSFDPACLIWFRRHAPGVARGQISLRRRGAGDGQSALKRFLLSNLLLGTTARPQFIAYKIDDLPHPLVGLARRLGLPVLAWTVHNDAQRQKALALADNIVFEQIRP